MSDKRKFHRNYGGKRGRPPKMVYGQDGTKPVFHKDDGHRKCARCGNTDAAQIVRLTTKYYCVEGGECSKRMQSVSGS